MFRRYEYYRDSGNTKLVASIPAPDLDVADKILWNLKKELGTDLYLFIRQ